MPDQRKAKRFELQLAFELVRAGSERIRHQSENKNVSSGGVLFTSESRLQIGDPIEYFITLPTGSNGLHGVRVHCVGKVLRLEKHGGMNGNGKPYVVAATLERYQFVRSS